MRTATLFLGALALALSPGAGSAKNASAQQGEAKLAKLLHGRAAGTPTGCIDTPYRLAEGGLQVIDGVGVVYDAGKTVFVARATDPQALRWTDRLDAHRAVSTRLCVSDRFWTRDRASGAQTGVVHLRDFVPYTKAG
jgi:hypothetical protein